MDIPKKELEEILKKFPEVQSISISAFSEGDILLHTKRRVGLYTLGIGTVLEPKYASLIRFRDIVQVGQVRRRPDHKGKLHSVVLYGAYQISTRRFVFDTVHTAPVFWKLVKEYDLEKHMKPQYG